ncbi:MAG: putative zinc-binding metallopeptidase [Prevotella sp.]|uniref:zinc-binding metallopeptidase n=1 Tax=Prevotella sp. TaxID=59823 RepID=UPI002A2C3D3E|nr:putative zinc-binding metallopeptidase [Prevotella sp.]MDD7318582.1 putative zinc-binding metallopeptidase [Prevotellaceae bacterium]MDY4020383.1 putative zinc-binding metallopeptidase [Prevotella sp.]
MKKIYLFASLLFACVSLGLTSCGNDDELSSQSVFGSETQAEPNELDTWIKKNYLDEYNIDLQYRYNDRLTDQVYNVVPAKYENSVALAIMFKHIWLDVYREVLGAEFLKRYSPRQIQFIGSREYGPNGSVILGTAEGGLKIMLYGVNEFDIDNPRINVDDPYADPAASPADLNHWMFHTVHHEFCHILTQMKNYSTEYQTITAGSYHSQDWINLKDKKVQEEGFVSAYGSSEYNEDFAEMFSTYVTMSPAAWNKILETAGEKGAPLLNKKLDLIRKYFSEQWGLDIDVLRDKVLQRSSEVGTLDLRDLSKN